MRCIVRLVPETLVASGIVAAATFIGIVLGFSLNLWDRKLARREAVIQKAEEAIAAVIAARYPPANIEMLDAKLLSTRDWGRLRRALEIEAVHRLAIAAGDALSAVAAAARYAPDLRPVVREGSSAIIERPHQILKTLSEV